jgi:hypothetical protein
MDHVQGAVKQALDLGAIRYDAVKHLILCRIERRQTKPLHFTLERGIFEVKQSNCCASERAPRQ